MIKLLWYLYFIIYLSIKSLSFIKVSYLRKRDNRAADIYAYKKTKEISRYVLKVSKTTVEVIGKENIPAGASVFVGNHQAIFDAFLMFAMIDNISGFIAKKEVKKIPLLGRWLTETHTVYLDRSNVKDGIRAINLGVENIKNGYSMIIFPEGTRSLSPKMADFKKGSLKLALKAKAPIVPFTINGTYNVLEVGNKVRGHKVTIIFHEPIYTDQLSTEEQKNITEKVYNIVEEGLKSINR